MKSIERWLLLRRVKAEIRWLRAEEHSCESAGASGLIPYRRKTTAARLATLAVEANLIGATAARELALSVAEHLAGVSK